eukprot:6533517-Lingulodinium_polyedra.AAC.1
MSTSGKASRCSCRQIPPAVCLKARAATASRQPPLRRSWTTSRLSVAQPRPRRLPRRSLPACASSTAL